VKTLVSAGVAMLLPFLLLECTKKSAPPENQTPLTQEQLVEKGQQIFQLNCTSCHGGDPQKDGPIGPSIAGSALPLIEARVMRAEYPAGYTPKRTTKTMVALPHLKEDLPAIHAYLNSFPSPP
jgi:mono/diheme cytochrome c family protein